MAGLFLEEFQPGAVIRHGLTRTVTESDNVLFSVMTMNPQPLHIDFDFAARSEWGKPLVNSLFTLGLMIGISVHDTTLGTTIGNLGMKETTFPHPVFHGDTIRVETEVVSVRESKSKPDRGIVDFEHRAFNQDGVLVARCLRQAMMLEAEAGLMRSLLFVPGDSERKLAKSIGSGADALIVDLEDSVAPAGKEAARRTAAAFLADARKAPSPVLYVRVNDLATGLTDSDLAAVVSARPDGIMLPKCSGGQDVVRLAARLRVHEAEAGLEDGAIRIVPLITETAAGLLAAATYDAGLPRLAGITWGAEDLSADVGARAARDANGRFTDVFRLARAMTVLAAAAAETAAIDTVFVDFRDMDALKAECLEAERDGFTGKLAIHPAQVPVINDAFTPSAEAIAEAQAIVSAFAGAGDVGVVGIDGKMFDRPHLRRAERLLARVNASNRT